MAKKMAKNKKALLGGVLLAAASAAPAFAVELTRTMEVAAAPEKAWEVVGDFCGIGRWHPAVERCEKIEKGGKSTRTLMLRGGGTIEEELISRDDEAMRR